MCVGKSDGAKIIKIIHILEGIEGVETQKVELWGKVISLCTASEAIAAVKPQSQACIHVSVSGSVTFVLGVAGSGVEALLFFL